MKEELQGQKLLTTKDLMQLFSVERNTVYNWKKQGLINFYNINNRYYTTWDQVEKLLSRCQQ